MNHVAIVTADDKFRQTDIGLDLHLDVTFDEWLEYGEKLAKQYSRLQWAIGDWLNEGERRWGEKYSQALTLLNFAEGTLRNYASICARIPREARHSALKFHQSKYVAALPTIEEQKRILDFAAQHTLTGDEIKEIVDKHLKRPIRPTPIDAFIHSFTVSATGDYLLTLKVPELLVVKPHQPARIIIKPLEMRMAA